MSPSVSSGVQSSTRLEPVSSILLDHYARSTTQSGPSDHLSDFNMYFAKLKLAVLSLLAAHASAKTIRINVGKEGLVFTPPSVTAEKGDILEYHFYKMMHSVALGQFANGCTPATQGGFFSGVIRTAGDGPNVRREAPKRCPQQQQQSPSYQYRKTRATV